MDNNFNNNNNMPEQGSPEYIEMMKQYYGEDYELGYRVGFWKRVGSHIIDMIFIIIASMFVFMNNDGFKDLISKFSDGSFDYFDTKVQEEFAQVNLEVIPIITLIKFFYFATEIFMAKSVGKMIMGLEIGNQDRSKADLTQLLIRYFTKHSETVLYLLFVVTSLSLFSSISNIIGFVILFGFLMVLRRERQALHDNVAKTAVFSKEAIKNN